MYENEPYRLVVSKLIELVNNGTLKPNEKVYSENRLANLIGIPRAQVREVYTALRVLGILYGRQGEGTYLRTNELRKDTELIYLMMLIEGSTTKEIMDMRLVIETGAAALAAQNRTNKDIDDMRNCIKCMADSKDAEKIAEQDAMLHYKIAEASGNSILKCIMQTVMGYIFRFTKIHWEHLLSEGQKSECKLFSLQHHEMVDAIEKQDSEKARTIMTTHIKKMVNMIDK